MRPHQYIKNGFVFLPLFFYGGLLQPVLFVPTLFSFGAFCIIASAIYILNDYFDIENDQHHPIKKNRPLASGKVSKNKAIILFFILMFLGLCMAAFISFKVLNIIIIYVIINLAYSLRLKRIAILDINIISLGFVLRLLVGSFASGVDLSMWIVIMTFLLALFIALAKRRDDLIVQANTSSTVRKLDSKYNLAMIDSSMTIMASVIIISYIMYTTSIEVVTRLDSTYIYGTALFVIFGILRYLQITLVEEKSGSPTRIVLSDRFMQLIIFAWISSYAWIIYY